MHPFSLKSLFVCVLFLRTLKESFLECGCFSRQRQKDVQRNHLELRSELAQNTFHSFDIAVFPHTMRREYGRLPLIFPSSYRSATASAPGRSGSWETGSNIGVTTCCSRKPKWAKGYLEHYQKEAGLPFEIRCWMLSGIESGRSQFPDTLTLSL